MITVGIPTYSGASDLLPWCLQGVRERSKDDGVPYEIVVVDDSGNTAHHTKSRDVADRFGARWIAHDKNEGITAGWNTLVRASSTPMIALLNDDIIVTPGWLQAIDYFLRMNPNAGAVGLGIQFITREDVPTLLASPGARVVPRHHATKAALPAAEWENRESATPSCMMCPIGCSFAFTREKYDLVGGFDRRTRQFYNESWFGTALAEKGHPSYAISHPLLWHIWSATFQKSGELLKDDPMTKDRAAYKAHFGGDFDVTDPRVMAPFRGIEKKHTVHWLTHDGPKSGDAYA